MTGASNGAASRQPTRPDRILKDGSTTLRFVTGQHAGLADSFGPETILVAEHAAWGVSAILVVHNTLRGPAMGGLRMVPDVTVGEVVDLARAMTYKNAGAQLEMGGGKSALVAEPARYPKGSQQRRDLISWFAGLLEHVPEYTPGPDMFTDEQDMQIIFELAGRSIGRPADKGGIPIDLLGLTSLGCLIDLKAAIDGGWVRGVSSLRGLRLAVEGFGNVGAAIGRLAQLEGAVIVAASDLPDPSRDYGGVIHHPAGLDVAGLMQARARGRSVVESGLSGAQVRRGAASLKSLFELDTDVVVPAARTDTVDLDLARRIRAKFVLQAANKPLSVEAEEHLHGRGVLCSVDYLTNCGGITACAEELDEVRRPIGPLRLPRAVARIVDTVRSNAVAVYGLAERERITPRAAAERIVTPRIARTA
ncbi:MAG TPA: Glu/Leu/Phe/Val dehydrogenase dimerization domain-containing protein [Candidatus Polarisedimenticolia bacterium]|nr:Glu/Leu/Phe/Val dehydrogenase dimerization domain-containing protein [Candidatus Polarisedimenticolia bacterium]